MKGLRDEGMKGLRDKGGRRSPDKNPDAGRGGYGVDLVACEFQPLGFEATIGRLGEPSLPWKRSQG